MATQHKKAQPQDIGHLHFPTKGAAMQHFRDIKNKLIAGQVVRGQDKKDIEALYLRRCNWTEIRYDYTHFTVENNGMGDKHFVVHFPDKTKAVFSFPKAVENKQESLKQIIASACRAAVAADIQQFKQDYFKQHGIVAVPNEYHVDHDVSKASFQTIFNGWIQVQIENGNPPNADWVKSVTEPGKNWVFADKELEGNWVDCHNTIVSSYDALRVVKRSVNLSAEAKETTPLIGWPL